MLTNHHIKENFPLVSILIPAHNVSAWIQDTIKSALNQTYPNIEIIIVDDHSTDNTLELAKKFISDKVHVFLNSKKGGNSARNYAFTMSNGDYIKFMDADDYCTDDMIEKQMERILHDGDNDTLIFSPVKMLYPDGHIFLPPRYIDQDYTPGIELLLDIWRGKGWNCPHCHLMHRDLFIKSGGWDETIIKNQDGEFFARVAAKASKSLFVKDVYAIWRQTGSGVSSQLSLEAQSSMLKTYDIISHLILDYKDNNDTRYNCARYIGSFVYNNYPGIAPLMDNVYKTLDYLKQPLILPQRRVLKILRLMFGWKTALRLIHKYKL